MSIIRKIHQSPFTHEIRGIRSILLYRFAIKVAWVAYAIKFREQLKRTRNFINEERKSILSEKKSVFVFANGPSLSSIDLLKVKNHCDSGEFDLIAINSFLSKSGHVIKPRFAIFSDNVHFSGGDNQYTRDIEMCEKYNITQFVPAKYVDSDRKNESRYAFCNICELDSGNVDSIVKPSGYYGITAFYAISLAKMLGYANIYLCGFDNSYFRDFEVGDNGDMFIRHKHYYDSNVDDTIMPCNYSNTSEFFFDSYRHFQFIEKISQGDERIKNIALSTYVSNIPRYFNLDVYKDFGDRDSKE